MDSCRACLKTGDQLQTLFHDDYADKFNNCTSLQPDPCDGLPSSLCSACFVLLHKFHDFKLLCIESDLFLRSTFVDRTPIKEEQEIFTDDVKVEIDDNYDSFDASFGDDEITNGARRLRNRSTIKRNLDQGIRGTVAVKKKRKIPVKKKEIEKKVQKKLKHSNNKLANRTKFNCHVCNKKFFKDYNLRAHLRDHDGTAKDGYPCEVCSKPYKTICAFDAHMAMHLRERSFACALCGRSFKAKHVLERHMDMHNDVKPWVCDACGKRFTTKSFLATHALRVHSEERPFACDECAHTCKSHADLERHRRCAHSDARPFACADCPMRFKLKRFLKRHQQVHSGERKLYECKVCGKRLRSPSYMSVHMRSKHTGERPYKCEFCADAFFSGKELKTHRMRHTGERPHGCELCGKRFIQRSAYTTHLRAHKTSRVLERRTTAGKKNEGSFVDETSNANNTTQSGGQSPAVSSP